MKLRKSINAMKALGWTEAKFPLAKVPEPGCEVHVITKEGYFLVVRFGPGEDYSEWPGYDTPVLWRTCIPAVVRHVHWTNLDYKLPPDLIHEVRRKEDRP